MINLLNKRINRLKNHFFYPELEDLRGNVLEIGFGNGENLSQYSKSCKVYGLEKAYKRIQGQKHHKHDFELHKGEAENLPFEDNFFDAVVLAFVLCSVNSVQDSVEEIKRVLKPSGKLIFIEHVRSESNNISKLQDIYSIPFSFLTGCHPNRNPLGAVKKSRLHVLAENYASYNVFSRLLFVKAIKPS